ncbi:GNAT family N-acetyltransferase [Nocardioides okcheonensis]|uniref:GNAT family N-acetyltransferase n=1 Tax=Nocardioides okcheonensis TaxID=2894081 RepID=UPI001E3E613A|nr:GNAT family N-acetyltransferase [Nocardioides okcheonensis]UFN45748.1 GNAT family N-acetyltransferase [Nocardioides okcheonensis]
MAGTLRLRPMTDDEHDAYRERSERDYAVDIAEAGGLDADSAAARSAEEFARLLPDGTRSPGMHLWTAEVDGEPVGIGWIELRQRPNGTSAWVFDIRVDDAQRGKGLGRALMEALHAAARDLGATSVGLNVFGHNTAAVRLYESLGYRVTAQQMRVEI